MPGTVKLKMMAATQRRLSLTGKNSPTHGMTAHEPSNDAATSVVFRNLFRKTRLTSLTCRCRIVRLCSVMGHRCGDNSLTQPRFLRIVAGLAVCAEIKHGPPRWGSGPIAD